MMDHLVKPSRFWGGVLLIIGNCIGAGMLALPILTGLSGFYPSIAMFLLCWGFMAVTGLLLLETNLSCKGEVSLISMASSTLGKQGKITCWIVFLFIFYCLLVAYIAGSGSLFNEVLQSMSTSSLPLWAGSLLFVLLFGLLVYLGTAAVDHFNRWLMAGLVISYVLLITLGSSRVDETLLERSSWHYSIFTIPILIISFGFHNIIPSLTHYFKRNGKLLKRAILVGSALPLLIYVVWEWLVLGTLSFNELSLAFQREESASEALKRTLGNSSIGVIAQFFAFFALVTSFLAVALSFVDFLSDGLKIEKTRTGRASLVALVLGPPFILALSYPHIFLTALNYAGGIGAVILFGVMPACMVWVNRYKKKVPFKPLVPGGRPLLILIICFALGVLLLQILQLFGVITVLGGKV